MESGVCVSEAVKIHCPSCGTYYHVEGLPIRGQFKVETTLPVDWMEMLPSRRIHLQTRWFYACPNGCPGRLDYHTAALALVS